MGQTRVPVPRKGHFPCLNGSGSLYHHRLCRAKSPPLPGQVPASPLKSILITLAIAVPIAMLLGALLALVTFLMMH